MKNYFKKPNIFINHTNKSFSSKNNFPYLFNNKNLILNAPFAIMDKLNSELIEGFKFSYENFIRAIHEKDFPYLRNITESTLGNKLVNAIEDHKFKINLFPKDNNFKIDIDSVFLEIHYFISADRRKNKELNAVKDHDGKVAKLIQKAPLTLAESMVFYKTDKPINKVVAKYYINIKSDLILSHNDVIFQNYPEYHSIILEVECNPEDIFSMLNMSKVPGFLSKLINEKKLTSNEGYSYKIADLDKYLNGNPLI